MTSQRMIKAYFQQREQYYSESKDTFVSIAGMHPAHAAHAAQRLLSDSATWAADSGARIPMHSYLFWMTTTPLFQALVARANGEGA